MDSLLAMRSQYLQYKKFWVFQLFSQNIMFNILKVKNCTNNRVARDFCDAI